MIEEVYKILLENQDLKYQSFQVKLCPGVKNILGVRVPILRKIVQKLLKSDYRFYLDRVTNRSYEETMIEGLLIAQAKMPLEEKFFYLDQFVPKINNWAICDVCVSSFHFQEKELESVWSYLKKYLTSKNEFEVRFLIVMWINYFLTDSYLELVFAMVDTISLDSYYVNMAIAWLISMAYIKDKIKTLTYLENSHLSEWTYQKALQKILESRQVPQVEKEKIRIMKKEKRFSNQG